MTPHPGVAVSRETPPARRPRRSTALAAAHTRIRRLSKSVSPKTPIAPPGAVRAGGAIVPCPWEMSPEPELTVPGLPLPYARCTSSSPSNPDLASRQVARCPDTAGRIQPMARPADARRLSRSWARSRARPLDRGCGVCRTTSGRSWTAGLHSLVESSDHNAKSRVTVVSSRERLAPTAWLRLLRSSGSTAHGRCHCDPTTYGTRLPVKRR